MNVGLLRISKLTLCIYPSVSSWGATLLSQWTGALVVKAAGVSLGWGEVAVLVVACASLGVLDILEVELGGRDAWGVGASLLADGGSSWAGSWELRHALVYGVVYLGSDLVHLLLPVQVSSHNVIGFNEGIEFSLQVFVLLSQNYNVFLESLVLRFKVEVSVHQGLVGIVDRLKISVLASLINFKTVELGLETLESGGELVSFVVFRAVGLQFHLLLVYQTGIYLFELTYLQIKAVNHALQLGDVALGSVDLALHVVGVLSSLVKLLGHALTSLHKGLSLLIENGNAGILSEAFLLPL